MTAPLDLDAVRAVLAKATPGPWYAVEGGAYPTHYLRSESDSDPELAKNGHRYQGDFEQFTVSSSPTGEGWESDGGHPGYGIHKDDAEFIAAARNAFPRMLAELEAARACVERLRATEREMQSEYTCADPENVAALSAYDAATAPGKGE